jgi:hypothetical protein
VATKAARLEHNDYTNARKATLDNVLIKLRQSEEFLHHIGKNYPVELDEQDDSSSGGALRLV